MAHGSNILFGGMNGTLGVYSIYNKNGKTHLRVRGAMARNNGDSQVVYQNTVRDLGRIWSLLPMKTKAMWGKLALRMPRWDAKTAQTPLTGYQAFQSVAWGLRALEKPLPEFPLNVPDLPQSLPDVQVRAVRPLACTPAPMVGGPQNPLWRQQGPPAPFLLTLHGGPFPDAVQVFACKPAAPNANCTQTWSQIAVVTRWDSDAVDAGSDYAARFGVPEECAVVWLKLVPISPNGFRGQPLVLQAEVGVEEVKPGRQHPVASGKPGSERPVTAHETGHELPDVGLVPGNELPVWGAFGQPSCRTEEGQGHALSPVRATGTQCPPDG